MARQRTAKGLGTRHDLNYFKSMTAYRRWKLIGSLVVIVVAVAWLGADTVLKKQLAYSAGPLSRAHAVFASQCSTCHVSVINGIKTVGFKHNTTDDACLSCHEAPAHQSTQTFTPTCASCHGEHQGTPLLAHVAAAQCTQCHADLETNGGHARYATAITGFNRKHPEFAALREPDPGGLVFNHMVHMSNYVLGPKGQRVKLECNDCHHPAADSAGPWKYGEAQVQEASATASQTLSGTLLHPNAGRELMATVNYQNNCMGCHALQFDQRFIDPVPHKTPQEVHEFVVESFRQYIAQNPGAIREVETAGTTMRAGRVVPAAASGAPELPARSASEWVDRRVAQAENLLWRKTCRQCHQFDFPQGPSGLPVVKATNITQRWMPNAIFSHESHRALDCVSCHTNSTASQQTSDVLVPSIKTCQSCHTGSPTTAGRAENGCFECHQYHDWRQRKGFKGTYGIPQLTGESWISRLPFLGSR